MAPAPPRSSSTVAVSSPARTAAARSAIAPPKRCTARSTTMPPAIGEVAPRALLAGGADDVAEHRTGLDRGELVRVADEDQPGAGGEGLDEVGHQRRRDHRGLVDDDDVERQVVAAVVAEPAAAAGPPTEQAVQGDGPQRGEPLPGRRGDVHPLGLVVDRLLQPGGGLAGRRGERDALRCAGLLVEEGDDAGDGRRLPGARPAGDDGERAAHRGGSSGALEVGRDRCRTGGRGRRSAAPRRPPAGGRRPRSDASAIARSWRQYRSRYSRDPVRRSGRRCAGSSPVATRALACSRSSQAAGSGHGRVVRSASSSRSDVAVAASSARSTHTWAWRGARTANAAASSTCGSTSPVSAPRRIATCTSAGCRTPAMLNSCNGAGAPAANRASSGSRTVLTGAPSACGDRPRPGCTTERTAP